MKEKILIVEDEPNMRKTLSSILQEEEYATLDTGKAKQGLEILSKENISLIISDIRMPEMDGLRFLRNLRETGYDIPVILITAYGSFDSAVEALRLGAYDYITKPFNPEAIVHTVKRALEHKKLEEENVFLKEELEKKAGFEELVGNTECMREVYSLIEKVADSKVPVLLTGESGTGKELATRAIHKRSPRKNKKFVIVNCGALPETLLESEIFGHEKGAFTGADKRKLGIFEVGDEGTIFLDEIGDLSMSIQMKLLRFLQSGEFMRVGGVAPIKVNVRIISATNKNLEKLIKEDKFRRDLYYRINTVFVNIPPLRERKEDIPLLVSHFLQKYSKEDNIPPKKISDKALNALTKYDWPGNVRELENLIRAVMVLSDGDMIKIKDLPDKIWKESIPTNNRGVSADAIFSGREKESLGDIREKAEKDYFINLLKTVGGNISKASKIAGISRRHIYDKLKKYGIKIL